MIEQQVRDIALDAIEVSEMNVRGEASAHLDLDELARSIEEFDGLLQPVVLRGDYEGQYPKSRPKYELIIGQRRFNAYREVLAKKDAKKWGKIPAVFGGKMNDDAARVLSLAENLHRLG